MRSRIFRGDPSNGSFREILTVLLCLGLVLGVVFVLLLGDLDPEGFPYCAACEVDDAWPCPDALAWWSVLTDIGTTYGVTP